MYWLSSGLRHLIFMGPFVQWQRKKIQNSRIVAFICVLWNCNIWLPAIKMMSFNSILTLKAKNQENWRSRRQVTVSTNEGHKMYHPGEIIYRVVLKNCDSSIFLHITDFSATYCRYLHKELCKEIKMFHLAQTRRPWSEEWRILLTPRVYGKA